MSHPKLFFVDVLRFSKICYEKVRFGSNDKSVFTRRRTKTCHQEVLGTKVYVPWSDKVRMIPVENLRGPPLCMLNKYEGMPNRVAKRIWRVSCTGRIFSFKVEGCPLGPITEKLSSKHHHGRSCQPSPSYRKK